MTFQFDASHHQHELEAEAEHDKFVREARSGRRAVFGRSARARAARPLASSNSASRSAAKPPAGERRTPPCCGRSRSRAPPADAR